MHVSQSTKVSVVLSPAEWFEYDTNTQERPTLLAKMLVKSFSIEDGGKVTFFGPKILGPVPGPGPVNPTQPSLSRDVLNLVVPAYKIPQELRHYLVQGMEISTRWTASEGERIRQALMSSWWAERSAQAAREPLGQG